MIYIISDTHFFHTNMIAYENRPFKNAEEMNMYMIRKWNSVVKSNDTVYHLGDFAFSGTDDTKAILEQLNGRKILVKGNHDRRKTDTWWKRVGFDDVIDGGVILDNFFLLSHEPMYMNKNMPYVNIHGHIHSKKMEGNQYVNLSVELWDYTPIRFDMIKAMYKDETEEEDE